jgi:hypothetical protein
MERQFALLVVNRANAMMIVADLDELMRKKLWAVVSSAALYEKHGKCDDYEDYEVTFSAYGEPGFSRDFA